MNDKNSAWEFNIGALQSTYRQGNNIEVQFEKGSIVLGEKEIQIKGEISIPVNLKNSKLVKIKKLPYSSIPVDGSGVSIIFNKEFDIPIKGLILSDFSLNVPFAIKSRISKFYPLLILSTVVLGIILFKSRRFVTKYYRVSLIIAVILVGSYFLFKANSKYYISQSEIDGLSVLARLPKGRVLVYEKDCLRCKFETPYKPAASGGIKNGYKYGSGRLAA